MKDILKKKLFVAMIVLLLLLVLLIFLFVFSQGNMKENNKAVKYFNESNFEQAAERLNKEITKQSTNYDLLNNAAGAEYKLNRLDEAQAKYNLVLNSTNTNAEEKFTAFYDLGNVEYRKENFQKAGDLYKKALKLNPSDKDAKYNLESVLLKLNEKNNQQDKQDKQQKEQNKKRNNNQQQNKEAQDLKKQMDQNDKAQKENEKKRHEENSNRNNNDSGKNKGQNRNKTQKDLDKEKQELDKKKQELSEKIKKLQELKLNENKPQKVPEKLKDDKPGEFSGTQNQIQKENKKGTPVAMLLNYYNESDKNADKARNKNKKPLIDQSQEDW
jgi:tetratricopeptide (TPR) repeat protein